jgi:hypothetical protein
MPIIQVEFRKLFYTIVSRCSNGIDQLVDAVDQVVQLEPNRQNSSEPGQPDDYSNIYSNQPE